MLLSPEFVSLPLDWNTLYGVGFAAGIAGAAGLSAIFSHEIPTDGLDLETIKNRAGELEKKPSRTLEQTDELVGLYSAWAAILQHEGYSSVDEVADLYKKAEAVLQAALAQGDDATARLQLGDVYLDWAVLLNNEDELEAAIPYFQKAIDTLKPLDDSGDGDAKYNTAGIKLDLGVIYREIGKDQEAKKLFEEAFLAYRAVEKIGVADTRLFMAKVSVQQGNLLHEMREELGAVLDMYNRAMRLLVEVIEDQQDVSLERDLANVLMDRCMVTYEDALDKKFESEEERCNVMESVLVDISRGIELLERRLAETTDTTLNELVRYDLFHALALQGKILYDEERFEEARQSLDRAISEFADFGETDEDVFLMQMAMVYAHRALVFFSLGDKGLSEQDCLKGLEMVNKLLSAHSDDDEIIDIKNQFQNLLGELK